MNPDPNQPPPPPAAVNLPPPLPPPPVPFTPALPLPVRSAGPRPLLIVALVVVGLVLAALGLGAVGMMAKRTLNLKTPAERQREADALRQVEQVQQENVAAQRRALDSGDAITGASGRLDRAQGALGDAAKKLDGDERKTLEAGQRLIAGIQPKIRAYETAFKVLQDAGLFLPKTLTSKESIAARRELLKNLNAANEDLAATYGGLAATLRADLLNAGLAPNRAEAEIRGFERTAHIPEQLKLRDYDRQMGRTADEMLEFLSKEWGQWSVEQGSDRILFKRGDALAKFQKYAQELTRIGTEQTSLQRQMLNQAQMPRPVTRGP